MRKTALLGFFALVTMAVPASAKPFDELNNFIVAPKQIIKCFHPQVTRWKAKIEGGEWDNPGDGPSGLDSDAQRSQVVKIYYRSSSDPRLWSLMLGVLEKDGVIFVIPNIDSAAIAYGDERYERCPLLRGVPVKDIPQGKHSASSNPPP